MFNWREIGVTSPCLVGFYRKQFRSQKTCQHDVTVNKGDERKKRDKVMKNRKHLMRKRATQPKTQARPVVTSTGSYLVIGNFLNEGSISREEFNPFGRLAFCDIQGSLGEMIHSLLDKNTNRKQF